MAAGPENGRSSIDNVEVLSVQRRLILFRPEWFDQVFVVMGGKYAVLKEISHAFLPKKISHVCLRESAVCDEINQSSPST